jgi:hypothetical protein
LRRNTFVPNISVKASLSEIPRLTLMLSMCNSGMKRSRIRNPAEGFSNPPPSGRGEFVAASVWAGSSARLPDRGVGGKPYGTGRRVVEGRAGFFTSGYSIQRVSQATHG